ncbi:MAG: hypothetical protein IJO85_10130 [Lachnospiraceae bacterium]|nr:hypothetical protein [Lachnospiraceae bacterium]
MYKKKKSKVWIWLVLLILVMAAGGGVYGYQQVMAQQEAEEEEIVVLENQELIHVRIMKMLGNEMTGSIVTEENKQGETQTWMIPVGTDIVTKLGTTTTFARLSSGDTIQMLMQEDEADDRNILKIWITQ